MTPGTKKMLIGSMSVAGLVGVAAIVDLMAGTPFGGRPGFDMAFLFSAALVAYMGWDTWRELT